LEKISFWLKFPPQQKIAFNAADVYAKCRKNLHEALNKYNSKLIGKELMPLIF